MSNYVFGFDFGTLSCRGVAIDLSDGSLAATAECPYRSGVISGRMKHRDIALPPGWNLQDPDDWLESMADVSKQMLRSSKIRPEEVLAVGTDFTSCTLLPVLSDGTPLCTLEEYRDRPNAWPKLWKHHGAQKYAERIEAYAKEHTDWLDTYFGGAVSSEWAYPKILQVVEEDPDIYEAADLFMEAVDYIVLRMTGNNTRTNGILGVNAFYIEGKGYPDRSFARALNPLMEDVSRTKLSGRIVKVGDCAGHLTEQMSRLLGLTTDTVVAAGHSDGAVAGAGAGVTKSGSMLLVMGTSTCHQMMYREFRPALGICSIAADGMIPGLYGYESGQPATGDVFSWFAENCVPARYAEEADRRGMTLLQYLGELAQEIGPGESGLIALDWLNGNRSILSNYDLSGVIMGLTLQTKPEEIYRALVEANIFGSRRILDNYNSSGIEVTDIYAVGGIARKSPWIMQMCADVFRQPVIVPQFDNVPARGAAMCAAVALGKTGSPQGCADFEETSARLTPEETLVYRPDPGRVRKYAGVYQFYRELHDLWGINNSYMKRLREFRSSVNHDKQ